MSSETAFLNKVKQFLGFNTFFEIKVRMLSRLHVWSSLRARENVTSTSLLHRNRLLKKIGTSQILTSSKCYPLIQ